MVPPVMSGTPSPKSRKNLMVSEAFDDVRTRLFLFGCDVSLVNRWSGMVASWDFFQISN